MAVLLAKLSWPIICFAARPKISVVDASGILAPKNEVKSLKSKLLLEVFCIGLHLP